MKNKFLIGLTIIILIIILRLCSPNKYTPNDELNDLQKLINDEKIIKKIIRIKINLDKNFMKLLSYFDNLLLLRLPDSNLL